MEPPAQTVNVKIYNQTYTIRASDGDVERTLRLAALVDQRMREIAHGALTSDSLKLAILAAILIADDLEKANVRFDEMNQELIARSAECADLLDQMLKGGK
jgi:cell division protein ZapA (FtsZ GTPase activity inhibitor)